MAIEKSILIQTDEQKIQENQYITPYHYYLDKTSYSGLTYFSYIDKCISLVYDVVDKTILDAGCGDGFFIKNVLNSENKVYGVDYSERATSLAKIMSGCDGIVCEDISSLKSFEDESVDIITNIAVIEHIKPELVNDTINAFYRVLKRDDGILIMVIPTHKLKLPQKHFQHFSIPDIKKMLNRFEIVEFYGHNKKSFIFKFFCRCFSNNYIKIPMLYKIFFEPVYSKFYKNCKLEQATIVTVVAKKKSN